MNIIKINDTTKENAVTLFIENEEVVLETSTLSHKEENILIDILQLILEEIGKEDLFEYLRYCLKELLINAKRANEKRIFFEEKKLDIYDPKDYEKGMKDFKNELLSNIEYYTNLHKEKGFHIQISLKVEDDFFILSIINNSEILDDELDRARNRMDQARKFTSIEEAFETTHFSNEGAGLGIIILILMLRKLGLTRDSFTIYKKKGETITSLMIPLSLITTDQTQIINEVVVAEIENIPQFPDHIISLQKMIDDPEVNLQDLTKLISNDPSLVADILRTANSALFMLSRRISSIIEGIKLIGLRGLKDLLYSYGTHKILSSKYDTKKMEPIWKHSYKVAFYAFHIAKNILPSNALEDAYIAGILHDIGKIILLEINDELIKKINFICQQKGIPVRIIEDITSGYNHALIGSLMAKKWNFPEKYIIAIANHHKPTVIEDEYKDLVYCVYLANLMTQQDDLLNTFKMIEKPIMRFFKLETYSQFEEWIEEISKAYEANIAKSAPKK